MLDLSFFFLCGSLPFSTINSFGHHWRLPQIKCPSYLFEQLILWYRDHLLCPVFSLKWSPCRWLVKPQAAHSVFLDPGGMPYRRLLAVVMFVCFFMRKAWLDALSTWSENRVKLREYMIKGSMCHVLLSVKLIVWICSRYFVDFGRARLWSVLVLLHTLRYRPKWHHGTWFWPFGAPDLDRIVMPVARGYDHLLFV